MVLNYERIFKGCHPSSWGVEKADEETGWSVGARSNPQVTLTSVAKRCPTLATNVCQGSSLITRLARRAGIKVAKAATPPRSTGTATMVTGSQGLTPYKTCRTS